MKELRGRTALVTGASRGIGPFVARRLAREGVRLALVARSGPPLEELARELEAAGCAARPYAADVTDGPACERLVERVKADLGPVRILVHNAGIERTGHFESQPFETSREVVDVNLLGALRLIHATLPGMLEAGEGHVVLLGSLAGFSGLPHSAAYAASKAALLALGQSLRVELAGRGVSASTIVPGFVDGAGMYEDQRAITGRAAPSLLGSSGAAEVAEAVVRAIREDAPELLVGRRSLRLALAIGRLFPRLGPWLVARTCRGYTAALAEAREKGAGDPR